MWIKICANTNFEDAQLAAELGADAVGFVFARSKRQVTSAQVAAITARLSPHVEKVGVFDSQNVEEIIQTVRVAGLDTVQLHGGLQEELMQSLNERLAGKVRLIQTLHWPVDRKVSWRDVASQLEVVRQGALVERVLIDSKIGKASGGTGLAFDWSEARNLFSTPSTAHLIVAGGLTPENVGYAITQLRPWGVDVASGVESEPGRKDPDRLARFIEHARKPSSA